MYRKDYTMFEVVNWSTLNESLQLCKLGKMWKDSVLGLNGWSDFAFVNLLNQLQNGNIRISDFWHTIIFERGKERLLCSLKALDRVEQKAINRNFLLPAFTPCIIRDNVASLEGRGMDDGLCRLKCHLERAYRENGLNFYISKADIKGYFDNIPHKHCLNMIANRTQDPLLYGFFDKLFQKYKYDSLIHNGDCVDKGIGLGGEVPQTFGILCLNEYDHICKEKFRIHGYIRYMDDIIMIHPSKEYLIECLKYLEEYLYSLGLEYNKNKTIIVPAKAGIKFLKFHFYIEPHGHVFLIADKKGVKREKRKLIKMGNQLHTGAIPVEDFIQSYNSYRGHLKRGNTHELINYMDQIMEYVFSNNSNAFENELELLLDNVAFLRIPNNIQAVN